MEEALNKVNTDTINNFDNAAKLANYKFRLLLVNLYIYILSKCMLICRLMTLDVEAFS